MSETNRRAECAIAIMAKAPLPGEVKTRLCPPLSYEEAAQLYRCFLLDKIEQLSSLKTTAPAVAYTPDDTEPLFEAMVPSSFTLIPQKGPDLGARLSNTLNQLLESGYRRVMAIDSDTPTLPATYLEKAVSLLSEPKIDMGLGRQRMAATILSACVGRSLSFLRKCSGVPHTCFLRPCAVP